MCLYTNSDIETCQADLVVYKILATDNLSPWREVAYRPNVLVRHRKALVFDACDGWDIIQKGFHAFLTKKAAVQRKGFDLDAQCNPKPYKIVKMVIPKGAKMVYGVGDDVVSTSLRTGSLQEIWNRFGLDRVV